MKLNYLKAIWLIIIIVPATIIYLCGKVLFALAHILTLQFDEAPSIERTLAMGNLNPIEKIILTIIVSTCVTLALLCNYYIARMPFAWGMIWGVILYSVILIINDKQDE